MWRYVACVQAGAWDMGDGGWMRARLYARDVVKRCFVEEVLWGNKSIHAKSRSGYARENDR